MDELAIFDATCQRIAQKAEFDDNDLLIFNGITEHGRKLVETGRITAEQCMKLIRDLMLQELKRRAEMN